MLNMDELTSYYRTRFPGTPNPRTWFNELKESHKPKVVLPIKKIYTYTKNEIKSFIYRNLKEELSIKKNYQVKSFSNKRYDFVIFNEDGSPARLVIIKRVSNNQWNKQIRTKRKFKKSVLLKARGIMSARNKEIGESTKHGLPVDFICGIARARKYVKRLLANGIGQSGIYLSK